MLSLTHSNENAHENEHKFYFGLLPTGFAKMKTFVNRMTLRV